MTILEHQNHKRPFLQTRPRVNQLSLFNTTLCRTQDIEVFHERLFITNRSRSVITCSKTMNFHTSCYHTDQHTGNRTQSPGPIHHRPAKEKHLATTPPTEETCPSQTASIAECQTRKKKPPRLALKHAPEPPSCVFDT